jgi:hypothetical protein
MSLQRLCRHTLRDVIRRMVNSDTVASSAYFVCVLAASQQALSHDTLRDMFALCRLLCDWPHNDADVLRVMIDSSGAAIDGITCMICLRQMTVAAGSVTSRVTNMSLTCLPHGECCSVSL